MQSSKKIKLIYDFYENDDIYAYDGFEQETKIDNDFDYNKILLASIKDIIYDKNRKLIIYSWGILRHDEPKCEISFDLTKFTTKIETNNSTEISFFCNHGKHRSVGWAEIFKKYYYPNSIIKHSIK